MAKKRARPSKKAKAVNKSAAIRDFLAKNPNAKPIVVSQALAKDGIKVSPAFVSQIKLKVKQAAGSTRRKKSGTNGVTGRDSFAERDLLEAKKFVDKLGVSKARAAVELLARLK